MGLRQALSSQSNNCRAHATGSPRRCCRAAVVPTRLGQRLRRAQAAHHLHVPQACPLAPAWPSCFPQPQIPVRGLCCIPPASLHLKPCTEAHRPPCPALQYASWSASLSQTGHIGCQFYRAPHCQPTLQIEGVCCMRLSAACGPGSVEAGTTASSPGRGAEGGWQQRPSWRPQEAQEGSCCGSDSNGAGRHLRAVQRVVKVSSAAGQTASAWQGLCQQPLLANPPAHGKGCAGTSSLEGGGAAHRPLADRPCCVPFEQPGACGVLISRKTVAVEVDVTAAGSQRLRAADAAHAHQRSLDSHTGEAQHQAGILERPGLASCAKQEGAAAAATVLGDGIPLKNREKTPLGGSWSTPGLRAGTPW